MPVSHRFHVEWKGRLGCMHLTLDSAPACLAFSFDISEETTTLSLDAAIAGSHLLQVIFMYLCKAKPNSFPDSIVQTAKEDQQHSFRPCLLKTRSH